VKREHVDPLDGSERGAPIRNRLDLGGRVRPAGHQHVAHPDGLAEIGQALGAGVRRREGGSRQTAVGVLAASLDVEQDEISRVQQPLVGAGAEEARGVERGVQAEPLGRLEQRSGEVRLLERLPAGEGHGDAGAPSA
jgi:hypothetical protein